MTDTGTFGRYDWLWKNDMNTECNQFMKTEPALEDFEGKLKYYMDVENEMAGLDRSARAAGAGEGPVRQHELRYPQMTIYDSMAIDGVDFGIYMNSTCGLPHEDGSPVIPCSTSELDMHANAIPNKVHGWRMWQSLCRGF